MTFHWEIICSLLCVFGSFSLKKLFCARLYSMNDIKSSHTFAELIAKSKLLTLCAAWTKESRITLAGVTPHSLHTVCMSTAGALCARSCGHKERVLTFSNEFKEVRCYN